MQDQMMCIRGRVGSDIRMHSTSGGKLIAKFRLAVPRWRYERSQDDGPGSYVEDEPTWCTVQVWDSFAHNVGYSIQKGQPVIVMGRPLANAWVGKDGELRSEVVVAASAVGHDLSKGCVSFFRSPHRPPAVPPQGGAERQDRPPASDGEGQRERQPPPVQWPLEQRTTRAHQWNEARLRCGRARPGPEGPVPPMKERTRGGVRACPTTRRQAARRTRETARGGAPPTETGGPGGGCAPAGLPRSKGRRHWLVRYGPQ